MEKVFASKCDIWNRFYQHTELRSIYHRPYVSWVGMALVSTFYIYVLDIYIFICKRWHIFVYHKFFSMFLRRKGNYTANSILSRNWTWKYVLFYNAGYESDFFCMLPCIKYHSLNLNDLNSNFIRLNTFKYMTFLDMYM